MVALGLILICLVLSFIRTVMYPLYANAVDVYGVVIIAFALYESFTNIQHSKSTTILLLGWLIVSSVVDLIILMQILPSKQTQGTSAVRIHIMPDDNV